MFTFRPRTGTQVSGEGASDIADPRSTFARDRLLGYINQSKNCCVRSWSITALGKLGQDTPEIREKLLKVLLDKKHHFHESADAAIALGSMRVVEATEPLLRILGNKKKKKFLRCCAAVSLGLMKSPSNRSILEDLYHAPESDRDIRASALLALGLLGDERSAYTLYKVLMGKAKEEYKTIAVTSLARIGKTGIIFRTGSRTRTVDLVGQFETLLRHRKTPVQVRRALALALGDMGTESTSLETLRRVYETDRDRGVRGFALISMALMKKSDGVNQELVSKVFLRALKGERNAEVKGFAALASGMSRDSSLGKPLLHVFNGKEQPDVRAAAALGLGILKYEPAVSDLCSELKAPRDGGDARGYAAVALGMIGDGAATDYLKWVLKNVNVPYFQWASSMGLALLGDRTAIPLVVERLDDKNLQTRVTAIRSLSYFRDLSTLKPLMDQYGREKLESVRESIIRTMGMILDESESIPACRLIGEGMNWAGLAKRHVLLRLVSLY
ncbi:MAG: HEAT repeat domain-containing protein [Planctomycetota bacterium]|jgi:HEAT repeat protein